MYIYNNCLKIIINLIFVMKPICIIPARKGSKRIKNKNIKLFSGYPLIKYVIETALRSKLFSRVVVSTDSKEIARLAIKYGAEAPFCRSKKLSDDNTQITPVLIDTIKNIESKNIKYHFCIFPTAPLINFKDLKKAFKMFLQNNYDSMIAVSDYDHPPLKALKINNDKISRKWSNINTKNSKTQDLEYLVHDSGSFYIFNTESLIKKNNLITKNTSYYKLNFIKAFDIDTLEDFKFAEHIYNFFSKKR